MKWTLFIASLIFFTQTLYAQVEELTFTSNGWELEASLYLPEGDGPFKAAVLVHGSGPINRYQTIPLNDGNSQCIYSQLFGDTIQNFSDIALHLQANNIAVLIYDKRTFTHGAALDPITITPKDFVNDAESAVNYLTGRTEIDEDQIFLIGHSQGAGLIPIIAQNVKVAGLVSLAGAVTPPDTLVANQFRNLYLQCLGDTVSGDAVANSFYSEFSKIRNNELVDTQQIFINFPNNPNLIPYGFPIFWSDWFEMTDNVIENYNAANLPTLVIQGTNDFNVPINDVYRLENGLPTGLTTVEIFEGINHFLTPVDDPMVDANILAAISNWIEQPVVMPNVESHIIFENVAVTYNNNEILINTAISLDAAFVSTVDGKLIENITFKNAGLHNIKVPSRNKIVMLTLIKEEAIFTKKVLLY